MVVLMAVCLVAWRVGHLVAQTVAQTVDEIADLLVAYWAAQMGEISAGKKAVEWVDLMVEKSVVMQKCSVCF